MSKTAPDQLLVLREFRLNGADSTGLIERIVAIRRPGNGSAVPLLTSVDDPRDVATLRTVADQDSKDADHEERAALAPFVESWRPPKWYQPRVAEDAQAPPRYYRMAVTESGINDVERDIPAPPQPDPAEPQATSPIALLWIGAPVGTHAGLLILVGHSREAPVGRDSSGWPLPLSRELGVRIYEGVGSTIDSRGKGTEGQSRKN
ncbi:MAG TPA: hypothetical protein VHG53_07050 [Candidatus Limnocylindria bacterium]|nr:hypothetical protein [Candidatus Limnocylindria bacterium]